MGFGLGPFGVLGMGFRVWKLGFGPAVSGVHASAFAAGFKSDLVLGFIGCAKTEEARLVTYITKSTRTFRARKRNQRSRPFGYRWGLDRCFKAL